MDQLGDVQHQASSRSRHARIGGQKRSQEPRTCRPKPMRLNSEVISSIKTFPAEVTRSIQLEILPHSPGEDIYAITSAVCLDASLYLLPGDGNSHDNQPIYCQGKVGQGLWTSRVQEIIADPQQVGEVASQITKGS